jgi:hypothetical protein
MIMLASNPNGVSHLAALTRSSVANVRNGVYFVEKLALIVRIVPHHRSAPDIAMRDQIIYPAFSSTSFSTK